MFAECLVALLSPASREWDEDGSHEAMALTAGIMVSESMVELKSIRKALSK